MRSKLLAVGVLATMWACGGTTFVATGDAGSDGGGSSSGSSSSGSSSGGSSSGASSSGASSSGASSSGASSSGASSGSSSGSGGDSGTTARCPAAPPVGGPCPLVGLECEYGDNPNPACNETLTCMANGWSLPTPGPACPPGTCPGSYADVPQNKTCSPEGLDCAYPEGQCNCSSSLPVAGPSPVWQCSTPPQGCPEPRPRLGDACSQPGVQCDYGACTGGVAEQCIDGHWQSVLTPCPV